MLKKFSALRASNQRGDTIVEVLISIAVVSMILGGAYVTTNNSLQGTRAAQERSDALKVVEGQLEAIKSLAVSNPNSLFGSATTGNFCVANGAVVSSNNAGCRLNAKAVPTTAQPMFTIAVTRTGNTFVIRNTWYTLKGKQDSIQMTYRVYNNE